jgi:hypothetical protein
MRIYRFALPLIVATFAAANAANASTFSYDGYNVVNQQNDAGQLVLSGTGANAGQTLLAWCLDYYNDLDYRGSYQVGQLNGSGSGHGNPTLTPTQIGEIGALMLNGDALINTNFNVSAAIQAAIWSIEYGRSFSLDGFSKAVKNLAEEYIGYVENGTWAPDNNVYLLSASSNQNLGYVDPTPLPSTWVLMAIGLAGFGFLAYRGANAQPRVA